MSIDYKKVITELLYLGQKTFNESPNLHKETGKTNTKGDKTIEMDVKIEKLFIDYAKKNNLPVKIFSEEIGEVNIHPNPKYLLCFDPLDGSTNYRIGKNLLPYGILISVFKGLNPKIKDVVSAGVMEVTQNLGFIFDASKTSDLQGNPIKLKADWAISNSTPVYLDIYRKEYYEAYLPLAGKLYIRNTGSTIGNLVYVLANVSSAMAHSRIKAEEVGAIYGLLRGAGAIIVNHLGKDLGEEDFNFKGQYQLIGGSKNITDFIVNNL